MRPEGEPEPEDASAFVPTEIDETFRHRLVQGEVLLRPNEIVSEQRGSRAFLRRGS